MIIDHISKLLQQGIFFMKPAKLALVGSQPLAFAGCLACVCILVLKIYCLKLSRVWKDLLPQIFLDLDFKVRLCEMFLPAPDNVCRSSGNNLASDAWRVTWPHLLSNINVV